MSSATASTSTSAGGGGSVKRHGISSVGTPGQPSTRSEHSNSVHSSDNGGYHSHHLYHGHQSHHSMPSTTTTVIDPEWEAKEELRVRELEEARARAAQMEKTMRWWSDCTANWREKWSKVRTERNKVRDELRVLRTKLEMAVKENGVLKREKQELDVELEKTRVSSLTSTSAAGNVHSKVGVTVAASSSACSVHSLPERDVPIEAVQPIENVDDVTLSLHTTSPDMEFFDKIFKASKSEEIGSVVGDGHSDCKNTVFWNDVGCSRSTSADVEYVEQRLSMLQLRLDEANKTLQMEREEKHFLNKSLDRLQQDHSDLKMRYEEVKLAKQDTLKELSQAKAEHQDEMDSIRLDLEDEATSRSSMDCRLADLRTQLEQLQAENAAEWGKRERLETEKIALERENKKLRSQVIEAEDRLERKTKGGSGNGVTGDLDVKTLQHELHDKSKDPLEELVDLRHAHSKLKKLSQDKTTELGHAIRRAEQYESEVKKLRSRVEELKKELATAEDEIDSSANGIRKLQRTNDELQEQVDSLQVQVDHLQTRLRSNSHSLLALRGSNSLLNDGLSEDEAPEF